MRKLLSLSLIALGCFASEGHIVVTHQYTTSDGKARKGEIIVDYKVSNAECADVASKVAATYTFTPEFVAEIAGENIDIEVYKAELAKYVLEGDVCAKQITIKTKGN